MRQCKTHKHTHTHAHTHTYTRTHTQRERHKLTHSHTRTRFPYLTAQVLKCRIRHPIRALSDRNIPPVHAYGLAPRTLKGGAREGGEEGMEALAVFLGVRGHVAHVCVGGWVLRVCVCLCLVGICVCMCVCCVCVCMGVFPPMHACGIAPRTLKGGAR